MARPPPSASSAGWRSPRRCRQSRASARDARRRRQHDHKPSCPQPWRPGLRRQTAGFLHRQGVHVRPQADAAVAGPPSIADRRCGRRQYEPRCPPPSAVRRRRQRCAPRQELGPGVKPPPPVGQLACRATMAGTRVMTAPSPRRPIALKAAAVLKCRGRPRNFAGIVADLDIGDRDALAAADQTAGRDRSHFAATSGSRPGSGGRRRPASRSRRRRPATSISSDDAPRRRRERCSASDRKAGAARRCRPRHRLAQPRPIS